MKKLSGKYNVPIIMGILFVIWNILVWTLTDLKKANAFFYCGYGFTAFAFLLIAGVFLFLKLNKNVIFSVVMPAYIATGLYFAITFIMNLIFMIISSGDNVKAVVIPNVILLLLYCIAMVIAYFAISHIGNNNKVIDEKVAALKLTAIKIRQIAAITTDTEVKHSLTTLCEAVEFSDPMGIPATSAMENEFSNMVSEIGVFIENGLEKNLIMSKIRSAKNKLQERNETLIALK